MEVKDQRTVLPVTVDQPVAAQISQDHVAITVDQPVTQLHQEEEGKKNIKKFLVVAQAGCMVRKTPDLDSSLVKVIAHNIVVETTAAEPAHANHPLVLSGKRVRVVSPVCGYASMVGQKEGKPILSEYDLENGKPTVASHQASAALSGGDADPGSGLGILFCSFFTCLCCLWPCGIVAIIKTFQAGYYHDSRRYDEEQKALKTAEICNCISFVGGLILWICILVIGN
eukprot:CAMPEP_0117733754 /NCGR_PEP_ID=MMETSP0947-20121206/254_1 /TAXON_ID=44440 /ORGANISM="Chattonella subsalsa, Strain CCMP2191" /LENGTH=226 /DNA_ID=CAMNT_0005548377 /DNA_START=90 /DNA_END=770 /DNA_ORIENTATION=+